MLLYFAHGGWLPWRGLGKKKEGKNDGENHTKSHNHLVLEVKENTPTGALCRGGLAARDRLVVVVVEVLVVRDAHLSVPPPFFRSSELL